MLEATRPIVFATIDHRAQHGRAFGIRASDLAARSTLVVGRTGEGKSVLLERLILGQIERGMGVALIDPHGDLAESVLARIPRFRINDVVLFDPADRSRPVTLNLLESTLGIEPAIVVAGVLSVFRKLFAENWGPRTEHVLRNVLFAEIAGAEPTLVGCLRLLVDEEYRVRVVARVRNAIVRQFWSKEFTAYSASFRAEVVAPVQNKLSALLTDPTIRAIVGHPRSAFSCRAVMDDGRILIANLAKGRIGEDATRTLASMLTLLVQLAAYSRADVPPKERHPFTLYADEFQGYVTDGFTELLAEGRKFALSAVLASQGVGALDEQMRRTLLGNVGSLLCFRVGAEDASLLAPEFVPDLTVRDLANLGRHQLVLNHYRDGHRSFSPAVRSLELQRRSDDPRAADRALEADTRRPTTAVDR
ncbi:MAG: type IV secretory system conjugative DNA transfer family protein, partial [Myxococcales bacterium]|nr:type IV secretory system conjugative DNA transfer family protein [Myxococcales bacterium]